MDEKWKGSIDSFIKDQFGDITLDKSQLQTLMLAHMMTETSMTHVEVGKYYAMKTLAEGWVADNANIYKLNRIEKGEWYSTNIFTGEDVTHNGMQVQMMYEEVPEELVQKRRGEIAGGKTGIL